MAGRVDQVELIRLSIVGLVIQSHGVGLDSDAPLALQIHGVQHLFHHFALLQRAGGFEQTVGERRLAVIDVRDDTRNSG